MSHGVGIIGAGPGVAALHAPTIARLGGAFQVVHVSDSGSGRAETIALRTGARWSSGIDDLLADREVDVVVVCSPPAEHARHVLAAVAAGKRAIFCEKPIATTEADAIAVIEACRAARVPLIVGTNHLFDGAWGRARHHLTATGGPVRAIAVTMVLPPNGRYHQVVTELASVAAPARDGGPDLGEPAVAASVVRQLLTGLAVHDLPLLRDLAPDFERVVYARAVAPIGYAVGYEASGVPIRLATVMVPDGPDALWRLEITTDDERIDVSFPPAFVHAGSASVQVRYADDRLIVYPQEPDNGYVAEWRALVHAMRGEVEIEYDELLADARYALSLADAASAVILEGGRR
ncbi:Gfo/Idh/MocA family oxidoreductase [Microbacterium pumilum]|uniref:Inositol 2-dehydrogenase n=1 Tax=Microbacterium pumilum TaxID=344165 RepID=A0ABN2S752_9MICO